MRAAISLTASDWVSANAVHKDDAAEKARDSDMVRKTGGLG